MSRSIKDIEERYKDRLIESLFRNINAALPHIERYYENWNWKNEEISSPTELLGEAWEDTYCFLSGDVPEKFSDDNKDSLDKISDLLYLEIGELNKSRNINGGDSLTLIRKETKLATTI